MRICFILFFLVLSLAGCHDNSPDVDPVKRTIIVYLGVDNDFENEGREKIAILKKSWRGRYDGNLLVYADGREAVLVRIFENESGTNVADTLQKYGSENSADPEVFNRVLSDVSEQFPADSYGLIVLSHGSGWLPENQLAVPTSIISDRGREMGFRDFAAAIPMPLDFIVFDACFMGTIEVAYELKDKVKYVVASPAEVLAPGFVYESMMEHLMKAEPELTAVAKEFYDHYNALSGFWRSATVSVVKTDELEDIADFFAGIGNVADAKGINLSDIQKFGYAAHLLFLDVGDYVSHWAPDNYDQFVKKWNRAVIFKAHTPGYYSAGNIAYNKIEAFSGMAMYVPQSRYPFLNQEFQKLKWAKAISR